MKRLILASGSPRRRELLADAGFAFEVAPPDVRETANRSLSLREVTIWNATRKALAVSRSEGAAATLGADTLVALEGEVIGKPRDMVHARKILASLQGQTHQVCTSVVICAAGGANALSFCVLSHVRFRTLTEEQIGSYLGAINPLDKAGAYAAQGRGSEIIDRIEGSFTNVVGLPMDETIRALRRFGVVPRNGARGRLR